MKSKVLEFGEDGRERIRKGVNKLSKAVETTLGPCGRNVIIEKDGSAPVITKDGVSVAREIKLEDSIENLGAEVIKEVSLKAAKRAGDGTTTATVLASFMYNEGLKAVMAGMNPVELKRGMEAAAKQVIMNIRSNAQEVVTNDMIKQVATISANNDNEIGTIIAEAMDNVGKDGVIQVQDSKTAETTLEIVEGMQFDKGYVSPYFVTDNESMLCTLKDPLILLCDKKINNIKEILALLESCSKQNKPLLIIAEDVDGEALAAMIVNKARGILQVCAVKAPGFGDRKLQYLEDIATLTGGQVISTQKGMKLEKLSSDMLGTAKTVTVSQSETIIIDGGGDEKAIEERVEQITSQYETAESDFDKQMHQSRMSKLIGGVAVINVGAATETELSEKADRVDDALCATRAAVEDGIIAGGGIGLCQAAESFTCESDHPDQDMGHMIVRKACYEPFNAIVRNAGKSPDAIRQSLLHAKDCDGYDARNDKFVNMFDAGIIDPAKVTLTALELAASAAGTLLTTECVVGINPEAKEEEKKTLNYGM